MTEINGSKNISPGENNIIYIGSDHAGFRLKEYIRIYLSKTGYCPVDVGNEKYEPGDDYPDYALKVARKVSQSGRRGIIVCDSGVGVCITANKIKNVKAVNPTNTLVARMSREHNNTNILCLGQNYIKPLLAKRIINIWLKTKFSREKRHHRRVDKIDKI
jgi:RpiB/LacA/LacB family sugar-phosphate isomerase